jgi:hypothetical protein
MSNSLVNGGVLPGSSTDRTRERLHTSLAALTREDLGSLAAFAGRRLTQVGLPAHLGEDLAQRAILRVVIGDQSRHRGRHPRISDLAEPQAFVMYLKGVVSSLVETQRAALENRFSHTECHDGEVLGVPGGYLQSAVSVENEVGFRDLTTELIRRLHLRAPPRLHQIICLWWEQECDCDHIPLNGHHRRLRSELRALAAGVVMELMSENSLVLLPPASIRNSKSPQSP